MTKQKTFEFWRRYNFTILLIISTLILFGLIQTYLSWPQMVKKDIETLYRQNFDLNDKLKEKADRNIVKEKLELLSEQIKNIKENTSKNGDMIRFLYEEAVKRSKEK